MSVGNCRLELERELERERELSARGTSRPFRTLLSL